MLPTIDVPGLDLSLRSYWVMISTGSLTACVAAVWLARRLEGIPARATVLWCVVSIAGALAGGWIGAALPPGSDAPDPIGLLVGLGVAVPLGCWIVGVPSGRFADALMPALAFGMGICRIGCLLNGCCWGLESNVPWCVYWGERCRHPLQLYFVFTAFALAVAGVVLRPFRSFAGEIALAGVTVFAIVTAVLEPLRHAPPTVGAPWLGLPREQVVAFAIGSVGALAIVAGERLNRTVRADRGDLAS